MNNSESPVPSEFTVIILAGFGNELTPLTNDYDGIPCPKSLLPVANKPMLSYVLNWVEKSGLKDVFLVCPTLHKTALSSYLASEASSIGVNINLESYDTEDHSTGTMTALSKIASRCQTHFVLLSCDFFPPPSLALSAILNQFRSSTDDMVMNSLWFEHSTMDSSDELPGPSAPPLVVYDEKTESLLQVTYDGATSQDDLDLRMSLTWKYPRTRLSSRLIDAHVYVCKRAILELVKDRVSKSESFKEDFVPWLCKLQYQSGRRERHAQKLSVLLNNRTSALALQYSTALHLDDTSVTVDESLRKASFRVGITTYPSSKGISARANNLLNYMELNRRISSQVDRQLPKEGIDAKASISPDSLIGDSTSIAERVTIKKSIIGRHCTIGKNTRISGSVIGDYCIIADGAKIENCILSKHTRVGEKAEIVKCQTQAWFDVQGGEKVKGEKLENHDWTAGQAENDEDEDDGDV